MPELPEVETTRGGIAPHITGQRVTGVTIRNRSLRWPISRGLENGLTGQRIESVERRAKYLLLRTANGCAIIHLGMSGHLRFARPDEPADKHDHWDMRFANKKILRLNDPRRFGALLWIRTDPLRHPLLKNLGPEPLTTEFDGKALFQRSRNRRVAIKSFIMDSRTVVGVGNIYASESLFRAGIHPLRAAGRISLARYEILADQIKAVLTESIEQGGTTLRDFLDSAGRPGYFAQRLNVYQRAGEPCPRCGKPVRETRSGQRSTFYCTRCQR